MSSISGRDLNWDWWQARTALVPLSKNGKKSKSMWVTTMSETGRAVSHDFHDIYESVSYDEEGLGVSQNELIHLEGLSRMMDMK